MNEEEEEEEEEEEALFSVEVGRTKTFLERSSKLLNLLILSLVLMPQIACSCHITFYILVNDT